MSYFTVEKPGCSFELERADRSYPYPCHDCGRGPCRHHKRDSAYLADGSDIFPPHARTDPTPDAVVELASRNGWVFDRDGDLLTWLNTQLTIAKGAKAVPLWKCKADRSGVGGNDPQDCDWPGCGCDPHADKVIESLIEQGKLK